MEASNKILVPCKVCGALNRIKAAKVDARPVCARCKSPLEVGGPVEVNDGNFDQVLAGSDVPILVDFWAPWCGPCRSMHPVLEQVAGNRKGKVMVAKLNTDASPGVSSRFGIRSIPTLILFHKGREIARQTGAIPAAAVESMLDREAREVA